MRTLCLRTLLAAPVLALLVVGCGGSDEGKAPAPALATSGVTDALIASAPGEEWLSYGRDYAEQRFSPLTQVNDKTIGQLGLAWSADLDTARGQEATPLMHDGMLYTSTAWSMVKAFDAATGKLLWSYDPKVPRETLVRACCDAINRGVALYGDKVYVGTLDGRLVALDQKTGSVVWDKVVVPDQQNYTITGAPRIVKGRVLIGSGGAEYKARGYLAAYDAQTGAEAWRFWTVPGDPAKGFESKALQAAARTWTGKWWELGGGGTVWDSITYDPKTNLVYFGTGNADPWNPAPTARSGDTLFTSSIVAVNADTGEYAWHYQETPEDRWDFDSNAQITIADLTINGRKRRVLLHAPKNGVFYVLDARTGQFISAKPFVPVNWASGFDPATGRPTINPAARYEKAGQPFISLPGAAGAHSWHPMSFSPATGLVYIPVTLAAFPYAAAPNWKPSPIGFQNGLDGGKTAMPAIPQVRDDAMRQTSGALIAWDPVAKAEKWRVAYPGPWNGGTLSTAGNLVFQGNGQGDFNAYAANTGRKLWTFYAQSGIIAAPMSYAIGGQQYVAIMVGWGGVWDVATGILAHKGGRPRNISRLLVFKLGASGRLPPPPPMQQLVLDPPPLTGTPQQVALGGTLYGRYCSVCHGDAAIAGALNPDLRYSGAINSPEAIRSIVIGGALHENGMVSFSSAFPQSDAEAIRQYLIKRASEDKKLGWKVPTSR